MIQLGYVLLTLLMSIIILLGINGGLKRLNKPNAARFKIVRNTALGLGLWFLYIYAMGSSGFLKDFSLPPRFPIFLILPAFLFIGFFLSKHKDSPLLEAIPRSWAIFYQSFRIIIESLFVATVGIGQLHPEVTFEGYNYDIVFAVTALIVGVLVYVVKALPEQVALYWNYLGLAVISVIIFLFTTTIFTPSFWGSAVSLAPENIVEVPYVYVAGFLMPSAVFVHVFSIMQLRRHLAKA